ncbi:hypothetical protein FACS1894198_2390 [Clostridia bacterium]|nr:hypothetical protein FACS1894198_2390 [Clostridia bacterium]
MPETNPVRNVDVANVVGNISTQKQASQIDSGKTLASLSAGIRKTASESADQALLLNENLVISRYIERLLFQAGSTIDNMKRMFLLFGARSEETSEMEEQLENLFNAIPYDESKLMESMVAQHEDSTIFGSEFFNKLSAILEKYSGNKMVEETVVQLLKNFDSSVNFKSSLQSVVTNMNKLTKATTLKTHGESVRAILERFTEKYSLETEMSTESMKEMLTFLKSDIIPNLSNALEENQANFFARSFLMSVLQGVIKLENSDEATLYASLESLFKVIGSYEPLTEDVKDSLRELLGESVKLSQQDPQNGFISRALDVISTTMKANELDPSNIAAENTINSMLANQSSVVSLLNFVLPFYRDRGVAFAQVWVDPDAKRSGKKKESGAERGTKVFCKIDMEYVGLFEVTLFASEGGRIDCKITCPEHVLSYFDGIKAKVQDAVVANGFKLERCDVLASHEETKLTEVFPEINSRRVFVDVKI